MKKSYAIAPDGKNGDRMIAHTVDCPVVRRLAESGVMVMTMIDCENELDEEMPKHDCLKDYGKNK